MTVTLASDSVQFYTVRVRVFVRMVLVVFSTVKWRRVILVKQTEKTKASSSASQGRSV